MQKKSSAHLIAVADTLYLVSIALARPGTVGGTRWSGVKISSFSCLTYTTIRVSGGGNTFLLLPPCSPVWLRRTETPGEIADWGDEAVSAKAGPVVVAAGVGLVGPGVYSTGVRDKSTME